MPKGRKRLDLGAVSNDRRWIFLADAVGEREPAVRGGFNFKEPIYQLLLWDTSSSKSQVLSDDETGLVRLAVSTDGSKAASTGVPFTRVWDTTTGKKLWEIANYNAEELHFTPDSKHLIAAPGGGQLEWHIWDADTGKPSRGLTPPPDGYVWMFAVSPDGSLLLLPTETDYLLWDMKKGEARHRWPRANQSGRGTFAPDGRSVVTYDTILQRRDVVTGKNLYDDVVPLGHVAPVRRVFFTPEGKRLISLGVDRTACVWDVATSKLLRTVPLESQAIDAWTTTRDGNTLVGIDERLTVHRWPLNVDAPKTSVELRDAQNLKIGLRARDIRIAPNGALVVLAWPRTAEYTFYRYSFSFWDLETGKLRYWGGDPGLQYRGDYTRLAPDGAWAGSGEGIHDTRTGAGRVLPMSPISAAHLPTFSADSRLVAASSDGTRVWEVATGRVLCDLPRGIGTTDVVAFSPDSRRLACLGETKLFVWDLPSGRPVVERPFPEHVPPRERWISGGIAFSPDGKTLASGHSDGTILLWSIPEAVSESKWNDPEGSLMLSDLGDEMTVNAYQGVWQLAGQPDDAVRLLKAKYPLIAAALPDEWKKLVAGLDSGRFALREAASKRLLELGRASVMPLRLALKDSPTPEQVKRIEALLAELDPPPSRPRGDDLRVVRAVAVLETCGTDEAIKLLKDWSERGATPRLADEAAKAVERMRAGR